MGEPAIEKTQYYGQQHPDNGCIIALAVSPTQWTIAVAYSDGVLSVVTVPELKELMYEANHSLDALIVKMAQRLGMVGQKIDHRAAPGVISLSTLIADVDSSGNASVSGRGELHLISGAAA